MEIIRSPDMTVEIVSNFSVRQDTVLLRERYILADVHEYWLVDARSINIDF